MRRAPARGLVGTLVAAMGLGVAGCNVWRLAFPSDRHDEGPLELPAGLGRPAILVFSKTNGYRHAEAIPAGIAAIRAIAERRGWSVFATEDGAVHDPELLERFDALVWHCVSGDVLSGDQRRAFRDYLEGGGGFVGIHGSGGDPSYAWPWYVETVIGAQFIGHPGGGSANPQFQEATLRVEDRAHPATRHLPPTWVRTDEWYSFAASPRAKGARVLVTLDESTYVPYSKYGPLPGRDLRMGDDHPVIWSRCVGQGRVLYSALGHQPTAYAEPAHAVLLEEGIAWAMGLYGNPCATSAPTR